HRRASVLPGEGRRGLAPARRGLFDPAHQDRVVTGDVGAHGHALEVGDGGGDDGQAELAQAELDAVELVQAGGGGRARQGLLIHREDVDGETYALHAPRVTLVLWVATH